MKEEEKELSLKEDIVHLTEEHVAADERHRTLLFEIGVLRQNLEEATDTLDKVREDLVKKVTDGSVCYVQVGQDYYRLTGASKGADLTVVRICI